MNRTVQELGDLLLTTPAKYSRGLCKYHQVAGDGIQIRVAGSAASSAGGNLRVYLSGWIVRVTDMPNSAA
jgi:hypothetical protein